VIRILSNTFFSPFWSVLMCITLYSQLKRFDHPTMFAYSIWTALLCSIGETLPYLPGLSERSWDADAVALFKHIDRVYAGQGTWLLSPPKLDWEDQIVLITGGKLQSSRWT
jgi:hypothetical protein